MEENKNKNRKVVDGSVVLSFVVAVFALISLVSVGFNQISYAAPTPLTEDKFTFNVGQGADGEAKIALDGTTGYHVPVYYRDNDKNNYVFCVEHHADVNNNTTYTKGGVIDDYGLLYLLNNSYASGKEIITEGENKEYANVYITQTAIWLYLDETQNDSIHDLSEEEKAVIQKENGNLTYNDGTVLGDKSIQVSNLYSLIRGLVDKAKTVDSSRQLSVAFGNGSISKVDGVDYYQTPIVNVTSETSEQLKNFDVKVSGVNNAKVVDENGAEITALNGLAKGTKFYIRIPADQVSSDTKTLTVEVVGHFDSVVGNYYIADGLQKVVTASNTVVDINASDSIDVVGAPNTGMSTAQTIYFIGLIVLLCGVGIVYANAKPAESK